MTITNDDVYVETMLSAGRSTFSFDGKAYHISGAYNTGYIFPVGDEANNYFSYKNGNAEYSFYGRLLDGFSFEPADSSFVIDGKAGVRFSGNSETMGNIFVSEKTEVRYDEDGISGFYLDKDKDGVFEHRVETGDVNCDGKIDASDASFVLQAYSSLSTGGTTYLNYSLADWNGDDKIDASDASLILQKYAELSTTK
ncbi:MAG: dockerin type I domain-containing protein [Alistipes sp.]|nr:dockerin type I domain-containing protein [Alistipes sp.]